MAIRDEYTIIEDEEVASEFIDVLQEMFGKRKSPIEEILATRAKFYQTTRKRIKANNPSTNGIFRHKIVNDLLSLGEIHLVDAIDLEFFLNMSGKDREIWIDYNDSVMNELISRLSRMNADLTIGMPEVAINFILAKSALEHAKVLNVSRAEIENVSENKINIMARNNFKQQIKRAKHIAKVQTDIMEHFFKQNNEVYNVADGLKLRKAYARDLSTCIIRLSHYQLALHKNDEMLYCKNLGYLRNGVSRECLKTASELPKNVRKLNMEIESATYDTDTSVVQVRE